MVYDFNLPEILKRLQNKKLKGRLKVIIDDSGDHKPKTSAETSAFNQLTQLIATDNNNRQHLGNFQHNKIIVVDGPRVDSVVVEADE